MLQYLLVILDQSKTTRDVAWTGRLALAENFAVTIGLSTSQGHSNLNKVCVCVSVYKFLLVFQLPLSLLYSLWRWCPCNLGQGSFKVVGLTNPAFFLPFYQERLKIQSQSCHGLLYFFMHLSNRLCHGAFVILMGDFNAKVGCEWENAGGAISKFGIGYVNEAGEWLIVC